jgi:thymidine kinase
MILFFASANANIFRFPLHCQGYHIVACQAACLDCGNESTQLIANQNKLLKHQDDPIVCLLPGTRHYVIASRNIHVLPVSVLTMPSVPYVQT